MKIRLAVPNDAIFISNLGKATFSQTFRHLFRDPQDLSTYLEATFHIEKITKSISKPDTVYWLAFIESKAVGFAKLKLNSPSTFIKGPYQAQLQKIYVLKDFTSLKIGFSLQDELLAYAKSNGAKKIWLSVLKTNERAINFYQKNGFKIVGHHDFQIGKEHFAFQAMAKAL